MKRSSLVIGGLTALLVLWLLLSFKRETTYEIEFEALGPADFEDFYANLSSLNITKIYFYCIPGQDGSSGSITLEENRSFDFIVTSLQNFHKTPLVRLGGLNNQFVDCTKTIGNIKLYKIVVPQLQAADVERARSQGQVTEIRKATKTTVGGLEFYRSESQ